MKKLLTFLLTALLAFGVGWAETVTITMSEQGWGNGDVVTQVTSSDGTVSISLTKGGNNDPKYYSSDYTLRVYNGGTVTVTAPATIQTIDFTFGSGSYLSYSGNDGSYSNSTWTANASSTATAVQFSNGGTTRIKSVTVTYAGGTQPTEPNVYKKVTSAIDLVASKKYIIVNEANNAGMGVLNNSGYGTNITGLTFDNGKVDIGGIEVMEMILGGANNAWTFRMGSNGNYLSHSGSSNDYFSSLSSVQSSSTDYTKWTISPSTSNCVISNNRTSKYIRYYHGTNSYFECYNATSDLPVALYVQYEGEVDNIQFSPAAGTYTGTQNVTISCGTSNATIYYTTDGSTPTTSSTVYSGPIQVTEDMTIRALAVAPAMDSSESTAIYTINSGGGPSLSTIYRKVTSTDDLTPGVKYILVYEISSTSGIGMGAISSNKGTAISGLIINNNKIDIGTNSGVIEFTMGGTTDAYTFEFPTGGEYLVNTGSNTNLGSSSTLDNKAKWTLVSYGTGFYLKNNNSTTRGVLYSTGANPPVFGAYALSNIDNNYYPAVLYVQEESTAAAIAATDVNILDYDNATKSGTFEVTATNLTGGNITLTAPTNWSVNPNTIAYNASFPYSVTAAYTGSALGATGTINIDDATDNVSTTATANYTYAGSIYIVGDVNNLAWQTPTVGVQMDRSSTGVYTAYVNAQLPQDYNQGWYDGTRYAWLYFSKKVGSDYMTYDDLGSLRICPQSNSSVWGLQASLFDQPCALDQNGHISTIYMLPGSYKITVTPASNTFSITPYLFDPTISVPSGTYTEAQTVTINCDSELATLYYTLDGSDPTTSSATVANGGTLTIDESCTLKVMAGYNYYGTPYTSNVVSATYTINSGETPTGYHDIDFTENSHWTPNLPENSTNQQTTSQTFNDGTYDITLAASNGYYYSTSGKYLLIGKNGSSITFPAFSQDVEKIVVEGKSGASSSTAMNIYVGDQAVSTATTGSTDTYTYMIADDYQAAGTIYTLKISSAHNAQIQHIIIYFKDSSSPVSSTLYTKVTSDDQIVDGKKYIIVYETDPKAFSGISGSGAASAYGTGTNVAWKTQGSVIDIANTNAQPFTLEGSKSFARLHFAGGYLESTSVSGAGIDFETSPYDDYEWQIEGDAGGYYLTFQYSSSYNTYTLRYNSNQFNLYSNATGTRAYLYVQSEIDAVDAPAITPPTGTYYENQTVSIDVPDGCTVYYTTNGSEPTTSSVPYTNEFTVAHTAGATTTIKAIAVDADNHVSPVTTAVYTWGTPSVVINPDSRNTTATSVSVTLTYAPNNANVYYTTDGSAPSATNGTLYQGEFTVNIPNVGDQVTVKAITIYGNSASPVATATYTHVAEELNIHEPFFTPIEGGHVNGSTTFNGEYYGDQTLQIGCTTPNADIYYEIVEEDGTTAPSASSVDDPTHSSIYYDGTTVLMTAGHSYRVKAIAYIGNYASTIAEGYYIIKPFTQTGNYFKNLKDFNDNCEAGVTAHFVNPVQVVYHSTYTNDGNMAEFCYVRDNSDYALVYFGKADQNNYHIFEMGDWLDGSQIAGTTSNSPYGYHIQVGTSGHTVTSWPSSTIGHNEILPEETTCKVIYEGRTDSINSWGHYVHLRYSTLSGVADESANDPKHNGYITDHSNTQLNYYDKFYRWSAGTCSYGSDTYTIHHIGDYDQEFFNSKQNAGATFDVYGIVDYYSSKGFQICPIDFLWAFKPTLSVETGTYTSEQTVTITVEDPDWALNDAVIYYKTDDMEDWAVYTEPIPVNSDTHLQAYAEVEAIKKDATHTNYNDFVRSEIVEATYTFEGVEPPIISPESRVTEVSAGETIQPIPVTVETNPMSGTGTVTLYTTDGSDPRTSPTAIELNGQNGSLSVSENTTVSAVSYLTTGGNTIWSPVVTNTYEFIVDNDKEYNLLTSTPKVGSIYVIVNKADNVGLNKTQNATNRGATGVLFTDNTKTVVKGNDALEEFVLESASAGRYYFRVLNTQDYLCVTTNDNANLMTGGAEANAEATVSVNSGTTSGVDESYPASIAFSYDGTARYLRYYANGRTFTTYTSAINQDVFLYGIEVPNVLDPAIDPQSHVVQVTTGGEVVHVTVTPNSDNPNSAVTYYTTDGSDPRTSSTRIEWTSENAAFDVNVTTTIKAVTGIEFGDGMVWSNVVSDTYTFVGIKEPIISPEGGEFEFGTTVSVTVQTNPENTDNTIVTWYTTDDSDPRTSETRRELVGLEASISFDVTENTTVTAVSSLVVEGQRVYSPVVSETYTFAQPISWPLHEIELSGEEGKGYTVQDNLIGAWYVRYTDSNNAVHPLLIAKDLNLANVKTYKQTIDGQEQTDYVKEVMGWKNGDWDQSSWVILDFKDILNPEDYDQTSEFVGKVIQGETVTGVYTDDQNYTMVLKGNTPTVVSGTEGDVHDSYPGYTGGIDGSVDPATYSYAYNTYVPANFLNTNTNVGDNTGFVAPSGVPHAGERLFFMNPKVMEVVRVWAVYAGVDNGEDIFTVYSPDQHTVNGWGLEGAFGVRWNFNRLTASGEPIQYGRPDNLNSERENYAFFFHAVIANKPGIGIASMLKATPPAPQGDADETPSMSENYELYPLDFSSDDRNVTAVREVNGSKVVESVRYYNIMGMESEQPFEGINIVVTRFSDGSTSTFKVLK